MIRKITAILFGLVIAIALVAVVQMIGHSLFPVPPGTDFNDSESVRELIKDLPPMALVWVVISYAIGTFGGGLLAALVARETPMLYATFIGGFVLVGAMLNVYSIPHPVWFSIAAIVSIIATVLITARIAPKMITERPS